MRLGSNGFIVENELIDKRDGSIIDLTNATSVTIAIDTGSETLTKTANITDAAKGIVQWVVNKSDFALAKNYDYQATVIFSDGAEFPSDIKTLPVEKKI